jgi:hypothetical protein
LFSAKSGVNVERRQYARCCLKSSSAGLAARKEQPKPSNEERRVLQYVTQRSQKIEQRNDDADGQMKGFSDSILGTQGQTAWERWQSGWQSQANRMQWALRNFVRWTPGPYQEKPAGPAYLKGLPTQTLERAKQLLENYGLTDLPQRASQQRVEETLTYLDWLDGMAETFPEWFTDIASAEHAMCRKPSCAWLDIGAKNWSYVEALASFARKHCGPDYDLDGVELDPHRRYSNLQTRGQAAQRFIQPIPQATYHSGDVRQWQQPAQVISLFLPFVFAEPHLAWGLPLNYFEPQALLNHALQLLKPGGLLIVVNQGEVEAQAQADLLENARATFPLQIKNLGQLAAPFIEYRYPRVGWLCRKQD